MSDLSFNSVSFHTAQPVQQVTAPQPPKGQSDHKPANTSDSSRGPAVVLSGAFSQGTDRKRDSGGSQGSNSQGGSQQSSTQGQATGQHINHVL
ncbi:MAG: hypothetical protein JSR98_08425 [Proteobacteria bacterium]|nr:hypothetical protein [Pseudomonadota bacterium]